MVIAHTVECTFQMKVLESQVFVTLELSLHPQLARADFMSALYISVI